jgi:hypothetical protein
MWLWPPSKPALLAGEYGEGTAVIVKEDGYLVEGPGPDDAEPHMPRPGPLRTASFATLAELLAALPDIESWRFER